MKNDYFRSVDFWKSAILTMPDNSFFDLLRSVFGKIKTPFNKQQLLNDLESFLLREEIQKIIAAYISETDKKIISAIYLLEEPVLQQLEDFFCEELNPAELQDIIVNMEERFLLYRFTETKRTHIASAAHAAPEACLALNPILKQILMPIAAGSSALFPAVNIKKTETQEKSHKPIIDDLTLAALYSFVSIHESFYRQDSGILKRVREEGRNLFPQIKLEVIMDSLQILGLFYTEEDRLIPDKKRFSDFGLLSARERMQYVCAAMLIDSILTPPYDILPPIFKSKIKEITCLTQNLLEPLNTKNAYPEKTLNRIIEILKTKINLRIDTESLLEIMEKTGLLQIEKGLVKIINLNAVNKSRPVIAIDSGALIIAYPEIKFSDAVKLASFADISKTSTAVIFKLTKDSAVRAFNNNISADEILELLKRLSGEKVEDALIWNLKDWEKRYSEVSLKEGIILQLAEDLRYLTETKPLASLISETIAPGVYILKEDTMSEASGALQKAGIDIISCRSEKKEPPASFAAMSSSFPSLSLLSNAELHLNQTKKAAVATEADAASAKQNEENIKTGFRALLEKMTLTETEKAELSARIDRRLVLCDAQLKDADIRYEKMEARHMDYIGKQNIIKQAISQQSPVEIVLSVKSKEKKIFGIPLALEKEGNDLIIVIDSERIPLAKIRLLRKIKKSIFEK